MTHQFFGSSLRQPWALAQFGSNQPNGRRPGTSVVYLTDQDGEFYLGGYVEFFRLRGEGFSRWHFRYKKAKRIAKSEIFSFFPNTGKGTSDGPTLAQVRAAKKQVPVTPLELDRRSGQEALNA